MKSSTYVIIMAGGVGTRFWPYSRNAKPKQFLDVLGTGRTLLQGTFDRFRPLYPAENIWVVTSAEYVGLVQEQLPELKPEQIIDEPQRKNTAACIALAAWKIHALNPDAVMVVSPADHLILDEDNFRQTIQTVETHARKEERLITLGIHPSRPETGYGYIQYIEQKEELKKVKTFTEKPSLEIAKTFLESGDFVWNAGIFVWRVSTVLQAFSKHLPDLYELFNDLFPALNTADEKKQIAQTYLQCRNISIDYGILEKADNVFVWLCHFRWSDLGSWASVFEQSPRDERNNSVLGDAVLYDTHNTLVRSPKEHLVVVQGLNDYLVGLFDNVLIVCEKSKEDFFRRMVNDLKEKKNGSQYL